MKTVSIDVPEGARGPEVWAVWVLTLERCDLIGLATTEVERDRMKESAASLYPAGTNISVMDEREPLNHLYGYRDAVQVWHRNHVKG